MSRAGATERREGARPMAMLHDFAADVAAVRKVPFDAPWAWLGAGWRLSSRG